MKIKHVTKGEVEITTDPTGIPVLYVGDSKRDPKGEFGIISGRSSTGVFVRFESEIRYFGYAETTGKCCRPEDLVLLS